LLPASAGTFAAIGFSRWCRDPRPITLLPASAGGWLRRCGIRCARQNAITITRTSEEHGRETP
ncbi:MAG: hypothetical protein ACYC4U_30090, partial [Pirellulaceae bacterium]